MGVSPCDKSGPPVFAGAGAWCANRAAAAILIDGPGVLLYNETYKLYFQDYHR